MKNIHSQPKNCVKSIENWITLHSLLVASGYKQVAPSGELGMGFDHP